MTRSIAPLLNLGSPPQPTVVLRHELPDGSHHMDWMIAIRADSGTKLATFRMEINPAAMQQGQSLQAERIADHRAEYLEYEGSISGNRGSVRRVASGAIQEWKGDSSRQELQLLICWNEPDSAPKQQVLLIFPDKLNLWQVFCARICNEFNAQ